MLSRLGGQFHGPYVGEQLRMYEDDAAEELLRQLAGWMEKED